MLEFLRQKAQSTVIQVIIVVIILVFVFWGVGSQQGNGVNAAATVNDETITYTEFQRSYDARLDQLRDQLGGNIPDGLLQTLGVKDQVLEGLIQRALIRQGAGEAGLMIGDQEVRTKIQDMEVFKNEGAFDVGWYKQILAGNRMNATDFELSMKSDLLLAKVMDHLTRFGGVADSELRDRFDYDYRQKKFAYVALEPAAFEKKVVVNDDELSTFFTENQNDYRGESQLKLKYVLFPFDAKAKLDIPEKSIVSYFDQHKEEYVVPEQRQARHILTMIDEGDSEDVITEKRKKAEEQLKQAREGADFADLARQNSDDKGSAIRGGDLGFFERGQMVKPFEDGVFGMQEGGLTLVRSDFGFHVIKLEKIRPLQLKTVAEVRDSIIAKIKVEEIKKLAFELANAAYEQIILSGSLEKYAESGGKLQETEFFTRQDIVEPLQSNPVLKQAAFGLRQGELSSLLEGTDSFAIFYAQEIKEPEVPELDKVKERVIKDFVSQRSQALAKEAAETIMAAVQAGTSLEAAAGELGIKVEMAAMISRADRAGSKLPPALLEAGLGLTAAVPYPDAVVTSGQTLYVAAFKDEKEASADKFEEQKDEIGKRLVEENQNAVSASWLAFLRDRAEVTIDKRF
ncbi:MAG: SurA N-terminal domain-containing protein [Desulfobulbaceae bacterium]|nr:SurA N-terminal domain-containing protein [Desulfobulbaceae bacterium]